MRTFLINLLGGLTMEQHAVILTNVRLAALKAERRLYEQLREDPMITRPHDTRGLEYETR